MWKNQDFRLTFYLIFSLLIVSNVTFGQEIQKIESKIMEIQMKQDSLNRRINQFSMGWDFKVEVENAHTNFTGDFVEITPKINEVNYPFMVELLGEGGPKNGITAYTEAYMDFNFRSDIVGVSSIWKITDLWGGGAKIGLDNVLLQANLNNSIVTYGTFRQKFTPLTLYYPFFERDNLNPNKAFTKEKERITEKYQVYNERLLTGAHLQSDFGTMNLHVIASKIPDLSNQRYIFGVQALDNFREASNLSFTYVNLFDAYSLAAEDGQAMKNEIVSLKFFQGIGNICKIEGEFAKSIYDENVFSSEYDPISDSAQNIQVAIERKGLNVDLNYMRIGAFYNAIPVSMKNVEFKDPSVDGLVSLNTALPYGIATPNRVGLHRLVSCNPFPNTKILYGNTRLTQILPIDENGAPCSSSAKFNVNEWGFVVNVDDLLARIIATERLPGGSNNFEFSFFQSNEKMFRENVDEILSVASSNYGLSWELQSGWVCDFGYKILQNKREAKERWDISIFCLSKNFDSNSRFIITSKRIDYKKLLNEQESFYSLSNHIELRVSF